MRPHLWVSGLLLSACSVGPAYHRPAVPSPDAWRAESVRAADAPALAADWPDASWWQGFKSPQLERLIAAAQASNDDLAAAIARVQEADAQLRIAGAPLFPSLDLGVAATRERNPVTGTANGGNRVFNIFNPQLTATYELDFWGKNRAARDAARAAAMASRFDRQTVALTVISSVAGTYFQALSYHDRLEVANQNYANGKQVLDGLQAQLAAGTVTGLAVAQQQTTVALLYAAIPPLRQQYQQSVQALAVLVGKAPEELDLAAGSLAELSFPSVVAGLPSGLLQRRPDVAAAEQQLIAANADITVARASMFPTIQLTASGGYQSRALETLFSPASQMYAFSAGLTQPIFRGGALRGRLDYDKARYRELLATYHKTVVSAFANVDDALVATRETAEREERQRQAVDTAKRAYDFARAQMAAGTIDILTVLNTENALFSAQDTWVQVQYSHLQALVDLYTALGGGWQQG